MNILAHLIDTDPYVARKYYVKLADELLHEIPGPHLKVMMTWPKWNRAKSPPPPGGQYLNPRYVPKAPKLIQPPPAPAKKIAEGPTLMEQPSQEPTTEQGNLLLPAPEKKQPLLLGPEVHIVGPSTDTPIKEEGLVPEISGEGIPHKASIPSVAGLIEAAPETLGPAQPESIPRVIATPMDHNSDKVDGASWLSLSDELGEIKGLRPDNPATGEEVAVNTAVESPAAIGKHFAVMAGNTFL
jgi:hypothetical protein